MHYMILNGGLWCVYIDAWYFYGDAFSHQILLSEHNSTSQFIDFYEVERVIEINKNAFG